MPVGNGFVRPLHEVALIVVASPSKHAIGRRVPRNGRTAATVGRGMKGLCGVRCLFDDPAVSRVHALVVQGRGALTVRDLGSRNGVWINGRRARPESTKTAHVDDVVRMGDTLFVVSGTGRDVSPRVSMLVLADRLVSRPQHGSWRDRLTIDDLELLVLTWSGCSVALTDTLRRLHHELRAGRRASNWLAANGLAAKELWRFPEINGHGRNQQRRTR